MQLDDTSHDEERQGQRFIPGPPQLPPLFKGQKIKSGPYMTTVTDEMVAQREQQNEELYREWYNEQQRRNMGFDEGQEQDYMGDFKHVAVRRSFIRKVFCILTIQLIFTACIIAIFIFEDSMQKFMIIHWYLWVIALIGFIISYCAISCSEYARRRSPFNYIFLSVLTLSMAYLTAFISVFYTVEVIFMALSITALITSIIALVATFSKFDLTMRSGLMLIVGLVAIASIVVMTIILMFTYIKVLHIIISIIGTLLLSMYLYFDIQTIMGGRRVELSPDEVVFATTQLYVDIILLYQYVLMFMGLIFDRDY